MHKLNTTHFSSASKADAQRFVELPANLMHIAEQQSLSKTPKSDDSRSRLDKIFSSVSAATDKEKR